MVVYSAKEYTLTGFKKATDGKHKLQAVLKHKTTNTVKLVQFGQKGSSTYWNLTGISTGDQTHGDDKKRINYRKRHAGEGVESRKYSPGYLSWHYLW